MKKLIIIISLLAAACHLAFAGEFSAMRGVWASDSAEAVVTDHACIFFENTQAGLRAFLDVPSYNIHNRTVFADSTFISVETTPIALSLEGKNLKIGDKTLVKVEDITTCSLMSDLQRPRNSISDAFCRNGVSALHMAETVSSHSAR